MRRWLLASTLVLFGCSDNDATDDGSNVVSCTEALEEMPFAEDVSPASEFQTGLDRLCYVDFAGANRYLADFGLASDCPEEASLVLAFSPTEDGLRFEADRTEDVDNGGCLTQT